MANGITPQDVADRLRRRVRGILSRSARRVHGALIARLAAHAGAVLAPLCPGDPADYDIDHELPLRDIDLSTADGIRVAMDPAHLRWMRRAANRGRR